MTVLDRSETAGPPETLAQRNHTQCVVGWGRGAGATLARTEPDELAALCDENYVLHARILHLEHALTNMLPVPEEWSLTATEAAVFGILVSRPLAQRTSIMVAIHRDPTKDEPLPKSTDVYVYKLRQKLTSYGVTITTVFGVGYRLDPATRARFNARLAAVGRPIMLKYALALVAALSLAPATAVEHHHAPDEDLEPIDVATLGAARHSIDMAAYVLTDPAVIEALIAAADRGVVERIVLNDDETGVSKPVEALKRRLFGRHGVVIRINTDDRPLMHLKAYMVDGKVLRTGSANFSTSGLRRQDNELVLDRDRPPPRPSGPSSSGSGRG